MNPRVGLNLILYDRTCRGPLGFGLSSAWRGGSHLYSALGRADGSYGASSWNDALAWLGSYRPAQPIAQVQYWGHGKWGRLYLAGEALDRAALRPAHPHHRALERWRERMTSDALIWFRTCETLGAYSGHDFARSWTDFFGCALAGHTFIIGYWQSGLHRLLPGQAPGWRSDEGLIEGSPEAPTRAAWSRRASPNTVSCLSNRVPAGW